MLESLLLLPFVISAFSSHNLEAAYALETQHFIANTDKNIILDVPYFHQINSLTEQGKKENGGSACGPTALAMVLSYEGLNFTLDEVINKLPNNVYVKGVMFYDLAAGPEIFGKKAIEIEQNPTSYYNILKEGKPIVLNVQNYDGVVGHALVIVGMAGYNGKTADALIVHDPLKSSYQSFEYINNNTLKQPAGYSLPIGIIKPFYVED
ncbi:MAG: C39 family peptidase [Patescibacteria group bacterium]